MRQIDEGIAPLGFRDDIQDLMVGGESEAGTWSIEALLSLKGLTNA